MTDIEDGTGWGGLVASKAELRAEAKQAALEKDAARYRWLLANCVTESDEGEKCIYFWCGFEHYNDVDAAIDAAIKK